jgi:hypothetical protein
MCTKVRVGVKSDYNGPYADLSKTARRPTLISYYIFCLIRN